MNKTTSEMKLVPIRKLVPYANNARTHSPEQINKLRGSLREFGFVSPVIIDKDYGILAGHGRVAAARAEGMENVPCVFVDHLSEAQKKAYILADNRFALDAGWDEDMLRVEMEALQGMDFDISLTGAGPGDRGPPGRVRRAAGGTRPLGGQTAPGRTPGRLPPG